MRLRREHMGRSSTGMGRNAQVRCVAEGFQARLLFDGQVSTHIPLLPICGLSHDISNVAINHSACSLNALPFLVGSTELPGPVAIRSKSNALLLSLQHWVALAMYYQTCRFAGTNSAASTLHGVFAKCCTCLCGLFQQCLCSSCTSFQCMVHGFTVLTILE